MFIPNLLGFPNIVTGGASGGIVLNSPVATVWAGDSITQGTGVFSIADWTNFFLNGRLVPVLGYNQGVSGNRSDQLLARFGTVLGVVSGYPGLKIVSILIGTNDIVVGGFSSSTTIANIQALIDQAKAVADLVVVRTILNRSDGSYTANPAFAVTRGEINNWIRAISDPKVLVIDYDLSSFDPTVHTGDGLHPNNYGVVVIARYTAQAMAGRIAAFNVLADKTGNLMPTNGDLSGTGGGQQSSTGVVATGYQVRNFVSGITAVNSKGTLDGATSQVMELNGTASANGSIQFRCTIPYVGTTGESFEYMSRIRVTGTSNMSNLHATSMGSITFGNGAVAIPLNQDLDGVLRMGRGTLGADITQNIIDLNFSVPAGAVSNLRIEVSEPIWRKVA